MANDNDNPSENATTDAHKENRTNQAQAFFDRLLEEGLKPHATTIAMASAAGQVAVVFYEIASTYPAAAAAARALGWRGGRSECVPLNRTRAKRIARELRSADPSSRWLRGCRPGRILVFTGRGTLCVNYEPNEGFSLVPGTTDLEKASKPMAVESVETGLSFTSEPGSNAGFVALPGEPVVPLSEAPPMPAPGVLTEFMTRVRGISDYLRSLPGHSDGKRLYGVLLWNERGKHEFLVAYGEGVFGERPYMMVTANADGTIASVQSWLDGKDLKAYVERWVLDAN